jgi:DNA-binding NtrC family response regulator
VLPPLRERRGDIATLAAHSAKRAASRFGLRLQLPTPTDLALLGRNDWPGNVCELSAAVDRATILGGGVRLKIAEARGLPRVTPPPLTDGTPETTTPQTSQPRHSGPRPVVLDDAMRLHIEQTPALTHGRIDEPYAAARILAINPHILRADAQARHRLAPLQSHAGICTIEQTGGRWIRQAVSRAPRDDSTLCLFWLFA